MARKKKKEEEIELEAGSEAAPEPDLPFIVGMSPQEGSSGMWELCSHGLGEHNTGVELYMRNVPSLFISAAGHIINEVGRYILKNGPVISAGETFEMGRFTMAKFINGKFGQSTVLEIVAWEEYYNSVPCAKCGDPLGGCDCGDN